MSGRLVEPAALLAGCVLSDIALLGASEAKIRRAVLRSRHPEPHLSAYDLIVSRNPGMPFGPGLSEDIAHLYEECRGDPLNLISVMILHGHNYRSTPPAFPVEIFLRPASAPPIDAAAATLVADVHLHSGASLALPQLLDLLFESSHDLSADGYVSYASDGVGEAFSISILLAGIRAHVSWLSGGSAAMLVKPRSVELLSSGLFWNEVARSCINFGGDTEFLGELCSGWFDGSITNWRDSIIACLEESRDDGIEAPRRLILGLVSALSILNSSLKAVPGEGLGRFVSRFDRMGIIRDSGSGANRRRVVHAACESVFSSTAVVGAEFRKTVVAGRHQLDSVIVDSLQEHLAGFAGYCGQSGVSLKASMPIGFLRDSRSPERDVERWTARYRLSAVSSVAQAIRRVRSDRSEARYFITGLDVAGDEAAMPSWPFLAAYEYILNIPAGDSLSTAIHAGESFSWRLQGLRRMAEVVFSEIRIDRLGHGLALDEIMADLVVGQGASRIRSLDATLDLCWYLANWESDEAKSLLDRICVRLGLGEEGLDAVSMVHGYRSLQSLAGLKHLGIAASDHEFELLDYADPFVVRRRGPDVISAWMLSFKRPGSDPFESVISGRLAEDFVRFQASAVEEVRDWLLDGLKSQGVVIEACPTSNARLAGLRSVKALHIGRYKSAGLRVSVNSDDPIIFGNSVLEEFALLSDGFGRKVAEECAAESVAICSVGVSAHNCDEFQQFAKRLAGPAAS